MDDNKELVRRAMRKVLFEKRAALPSDINLSADIVDSWLDDFAQAALSIIQPELQKRDEALEQIKRISKDYGIEAEYKYKESELAHYFYKLHIIAENALKTTTGHDNNGG